MKRIKYILGNIPELISCCAFAVMLCVVFVNVLLRYLFHKSLVWNEEVAAISFIWVIFVGAAACYKRGQLIGIDVLVSILPEKAKRGVRILVTFIMLFFNLWLTYLSLVFSLGAWSKISLSLQIPYTFFDIASTVGFSFMSYYSLKNVIACIRGEEPESEEDEIERQAKSY
ncbi:MAG: TRAP transporter small permease [Eubacteriales bacterium]|jgi:TRAP-type C4-dicarboxylate transport system permease small subunit